MESCIKNINFAVWYRGMKTIKFDKIYRDTYYLTNNDKIQLKGNEIYLNSILITNDPGLSCDEFISLYKSNLLKRNYKFI